MKNLTLTLEEEINILDRYKLTPTELRFTQILLLLQDENNEELFSRFIKSLKTAGVSPRDVILSLQEKGIILKSYKVPKSGESFDPYSIPINKNFIKNIYKCSFELGKELFESYPQFGIIQGNSVALRGVSRHFNSLEDAYFKYGRNIKWNPDTHNHIIELVSWGKDNNLICQSLSSFIINNGWLDLEAMKNGDTANINYNAIRLL